MVSNSFFNVVYKHFTVHHIKDPCSLCGEMIGSSVMTVHLQFKHNINRPEKKWNCQYCGKAFRGSSNLRDHENTHTGARPHMCKNCGICFAQSGSYSNHKKSCKPKPVVLQTHPALDFSPTYK